MEEKSKKSKEQKNPSKNSENLSGIKNQPLKILTGTIEAVDIDDASFTKKFYEYNKNLSKQNKNNQEQKLKSKKFREKLKKTRELYNDVKSPSFQGPWSKYKDEHIFDNPNYEEIQNITQTLPKTENKNIQENNNNNQSENNNINKIIEPKVIIDYDQGLDYQGRSFIHPPSTLKNVEHVCYIPKKLKHTYYGHNKLVQTIQFFPKYGHLLLSCSSDNKIKIWDVLSHKKCLRTYLGHSEGVRDICFSNDGTKFLSSSFDKNIILWDTETGEVLNTYQLKNIPLCIKFNPDIEQNNEFIVGTNLTKIINFDINEKTNKPIQIYDEHLGSINSITFIDNARKFISTSDDKKIFVWEYGIPNAVKHISDPTMYAISSAVLHPEQKYFLGQSLDNVIVTYDIYNNFKLYRKKQFTGHVNAGNVCGLDCSPDGRYLCSGDADGKLWFWDFKTTKNYATILAHKGIVSDVKWNPISPSLVASCAADGTIKLWDSK